MDLPVQTRPAVAAPTAVSPAGGLLGRLPGLPIVVLVVAVATDRLGIRVRGLNLRLELIAALLLLAWVLVSQGLSPARRIGVIEWCLAGWLAVTALSSAVFSPDPRQSLKFTLLLTGMVALYAVTVALLRTPADVVRAALVWVGVGAAVAALGAIEGLAYIGAGSTLGVTFDGNAEGNLAVITPKITSLLWEANIFGSYLLTVWAVAFGLSLAPAFRSRMAHRALGAGMALASCGMVLSTTRTVWVVAPVLGVGMAVVALRAGVVSGRRLMAGVLNPSLVGIAFGLAITVGMTGGTCPLPTVAPASATSPTPQQSGYASVGSPATDSNPLTGPGCVRGGSAFLRQASGFFHPGRVSSFTGRIQINQLAFHGWLRRPIFGWGAGAFTTVYGALGGGWIGNLELHTLFDSGLAGFLLLLLAALAAGRRAVRALLIGVRGFSAAHYGTFGILAGALALTLTYQFTEGTWLGFTWVYFGLLAAAGRLASERPHPTSGAASYPPAT